MPDGSRRRFVGHLGVLAGGSLLTDGIASWGAHTTANWRKVGRQTLWSVDAGQVQVTRGPWTSLPEMVPGVRLESLRLRMPDGVHLHALLYLPGLLSAMEPIPALLKTTPYRHMPQPDEYLARHGYASLHLDVRGSGASEGIPEDEYSDQEQFDTAAVIDWLSKQPWCNGNIGMHGVSYSAINSVWVAATIKPPALKAIFVRAGHDARYTDDIHFPGGAMLMVDNSWAIGMVKDNAMPGAPDFPLHSKASMDRWDTPPWLMRFLRHQRYGPYWERASLAPHYERLEVPTFLAGGYLDIYQNFVPRIMRYSPAISRGVLGPWHHGVVPGPQMNWGAMQVRWFDRWLKGIDNGIDREPRASFFMPRWQPQTFRYINDVPGEWRHLGAWPDSVFDPPERLYLRPDPVEQIEAAAAPKPGQGGYLEELSSKPAALELRYHPATGGWGQSHGPTTSEGYYGLDHRSEDAYGLSFDTAPMHRPLEILGFTRARLFVSSTAPIANWIVRLNDVAPDGTSYMVSRGFLNGTHRDSHRNPEPLVPDEVYEIEVEMWCVAHTFEPGHRIRLVVTNADFPVLWPSPENMTTTLYTGGDRPSHVELPALAASRYGKSELRLMETDNQQLSTSEEHDASNNLKDGVCSVCSDDDNVHAYQRTHDIAAGQHTAYFEFGDDRIWCRVDENNPAVSSVRFEGMNTAHTNDGRRIDSRASGTLSSDAQAFTLDIECTLLENDELVRMRRWEDRVPRDGV